LKFQLQIYLYYSIHFEDSKLYLIWKEKIL
jgi:hypothetical protein